MTVNITFLHLVESCAICFVILLLTSVGQRGKAIRREEFPPLSVNVWTLRHSWRRFVPCNTTQQLHALTLLLMEASPSAQQLLTNNWWLNMPRQWAACLACPGTLKLQVPRAERNLFSRVCTIRGRGYGFLVLPSVMETAAALQEWNHGGIQMQMYLLTLG